MKTAANGDILVLGVHSWGDWQKPESMRRLSRVYRFTPEGKLVWALPKVASARMTLLYMDADPEGRRVAVLTGELAGDAPENYSLRPGALISLDGTNGGLTGQHVFRPLAPYYDKVMFWQSVSVDSEGKRASVGLHDGRSFIFNLDTLEPIHQFEFGVPIMISDIPVSAFSTYTKIGPNGTTYLQTGNSSVPTGSAAGEMVAPPGPHPNANTINAVDPNGKVLWRYSGGHHSQNFWLSANGRWMVSSAQKQTDETGRSSGAILFDTHRPGGGSSKMVYFYPVEGKAFFQADISPDGALTAVVETPYLDPETKSLQGSYQVHVIR